MALRSERVNPFTPKSDQFQNLSCSPTSNITSHSMKNLVFIANTQMKDDCTTNSHPQFFLFFRTAEGNRAFPQLSKFPLTGHGRTTTGASQSAACSAALCRSALLAFCAPCTWVELCWTEVSSVFPPHSPRGPVSLAWAPWGKGARRRMTFQTRTRTLLPEPHELAV